MNELPEIRISVDIDIFYDTSSNIAATSNPYVKLPYTEFSEIRDFLWKHILKNSDNFKLLSFKPSDKAEPDRTILRPIFQIKDSDPELYEQKIEEYLKTQPTSSSFYMVANSLNSFGIPISKWIIDCRISNHNDSSKSRSAETNKKSYEYYDDKFNNGQRDSILIPSRIKLSYRTVQNYQDKYQEYRLDLSEVSNASIICNTVEDVKTEIQNYFQHLWDICNEITLPDVPIIRNNVECSTSLYNSDNIDDYVSNILLDLEYALIKYSKSLEEFYGYSWDCISADIEDFNIKQIYIRDNFGEDFVIYTDISVEYYYENNSYREDTLQNLAISVYEGYDIGY